jgi:Protein of unknown function (DUF4876)
MMIRRTVLVCLAGTCLTFASCGVDRPLYPDGRNTLEIVAIDTSGVTGEDSVLVAGALVELASTTAEYKQVFQTDPEGRVVVENLPAGEYIVQVSKQDEVSKVLFMGQGTERLVNAVGILDTIYMSFIPTSPIVINEVYYAGCNASSFYFYDQFIELYNTTEDTLYLDGYFVVRGTQVSTIFDYDPNQEDFALGYYIYTFPGTRGVTHQCPIAPKGFIVIAGDATNHHNYGALCVDLSHADYEFFNAAANDFDNPSVPNLDALWSGSNDFTMNLAHSPVWIATGEDYTYQEHCYMSGTSTICTTYMHMMLSTILDGVEYASNPTSARYTPPRMDAGFGGIGLTRYSGQSIERKVPGLDSNNSIFDFENITPTPGYSHSR